MEQQEEHIGYLPIYYEPTHNEFFVGKDAFYTEAIALDEALQTIHYNKEVGHCEVRLVEIAQVKCADRTAEFHKRIRGEEYDPEHPKFSRIFPF